MSRKSFIVKRKKHLTESDKDFINGIDNLKTKKHSNLNIFNLSYQNLNGKLFHIYSHQDVYWKPSLKIVLKVSFNLIL